MISLDHLFTCWHEFKRGKRRQRAVQQFERFLEDNIFRLREDLASFLYKHGPYEQFRVCDPKERLISKASVRDRLVHHILIGIENCTFANAKEASLHPTHLGSSFQ